MTHEIRNLYRNINKSTTKTINDSLFGHNLFAVDIFGGCWGGSEISPTSGATKWCTGEIGEPANREQHNQITKEKGIHTHSTKEKRIHTHSSCPFSLTLVYSKFLIKQEELIYV